MAQAPMISCPLKQTNEIDWINPLKAYIRSSYGDDPERYSEECATLNRLRQDMRGAGKDSASGRDLLYRYYGQLELLDLRFPVDENHIKISFTWFDAFTHKPTSQYSLAFEKASIIFNISAVLSCHAANQNRSEDTGLKTAYHSFQASAGMFTYINENFLHAPSTDLSRDTVKTLIHITLAQGQEVFLEKQVADGKKAGLLAKLAAQAAFLYAQAVEGVEENVAKAVFDRSWITVTRVKAGHLASLSEYYQALADDESNQHGSAIARLLLAEKSAKSAHGLAKTFPSTAPPNSNLSSETGPNLTSLTKRQLDNVQEKLAALTKDNDFIYHQTVPAEAALAGVSKLPAAKAIPVSELYQGQDIQRIIGPDIFQKIIPLSVTETASLYDEEKAKLIRSEAEKVETANGEMAASLDYLKLPGSLNILKGGMDQEMTVDDDFRHWCEDLAGHEPFSKAFDQLQSDKAMVLEILGKTSKQLDMEESVCEKMRSKYGGDWTQQPSSRLTSTLRSDIRSYRETIDQASTSDSQLLATARQYEADFDEMRSAGETDEADVLYQRGLIKAGGGRGKGRESDSPAGEGNLLDEDYGEGGISIPDQIAKVEELLKKFNLIKRERTQVLKDLKERVHNDDISNVLILNKKSIAGNEQQLFNSELEKFRPHQTRLLQASHKQASLMKELTRTYGDLLQDKRVRSEQSKYEAVSRQKNSVISKYKRVYQAFNDLISGLMRAQGFYSEMRDTIDSLEKNVETFVNNRRAEGAQLLNQIERDKAASSGGQANAERERLQLLMERMSMEPQASSPSQNRPSPIANTSYQNNSYTSRSPPASPHYPTSTPGLGAQYTIPPSRSPANLNTSQQQTYKPPNANGNYHLPPQSAGGFYGQGAAGSLSDPYNPMAYPYQPSTSPAPPQQQQYFSPTSPPTTGGYYQLQQPSQSQQQQRQQQHQQAPPTPLQFQSPTHHQLQSPPPQQQYQSPPPQQQYAGMPQGYVPPPPPPGPPPHSGTHYPPANGPYANGPGGYAQPPRGQYGGQQQPQQQPGGGQGDPWAGLSAWR